MTTDGKFEYSVGLGPSHYFHRENGILCSFLHCVCVFAWVRVCERGLHVGYLIELTLYIALGL